MIGLVQSLPQVITAIGGLGTAAFGLVEASKPVLGINYIGFEGIKTTVAKLTPSAPANGLSQEKILATLEANWINGTDVGGQKSIAKSLIKLNLNADNAAALARETGVDSDVLTAIGKSIAAGNPLTSDQNNVYARFDLIVTALLDEAYQRSDQVYRNWTRAIAAVFAVVLAIVGGFMLHTSGSPSRQDIGLSLLVGLLATPLAPIAKDLSTALATAVNTLQLVKK